MLGGGLVHRAATLPEHNRCMNDRCKHSKQLIHGGLFLLYKATTLGYSYDKQRHVTLHLHLQARVCTAHCSHAAIASCMVEKDAAGSLS